MKPYIQQLRTWGPRIASLALLLSSVWCYSIYHDAKWKETIRFVKQWVRFLQGVDV